MTLEGSRKVLPFIGPAMYFLPSIATGLGNTQWVLWQSSTGLFIYSFIHRVNAVKYHFRQLCITSTKYLANTVEGENICLRFQKPQRKRSTWCIGLDLRSNRISWWCMVEEAAHLMLLRKQKGKQRKRPLQSAPAFDSFHHFPIIRVIISLLMEPGKNLLLLHRTQVQFPVPAWCLTTFYNSSSNWLPVAVAHTWCIHMKMNKSIISNNKITIDDSIHRFDQSPHNPVTFRNSDVNQPFNTGFFFYEDISHPKHFKQKPYVGVRDTEAL